MPKILKAAVIAGLVLGTALLALGVLARWYPALDIINNGLPVLAVGGIALLALAFAVRTRTLITATAAFIAVSFALLLSGLSGAAPQAPDGAARFLRVATFNLWGRNDHHLNQVAAFLAETKADAVVLEEVRGHHKDFLESLAGQYPYRVGDNGLAILSKHPIVADGLVDRGGQPFWMSRIVRWVRLDVDGTQVELAGVHLARPFYPDLQEADIHLRTGEEWPLDRGGGFQHGAVDGQAEDLHQGDRARPFQHVLPDLADALEKRAPFCRWCRSTMSSPRNISPRSTPASARGSIRITGL